MSPVEPSNSFRSKLGLAAAVLGCLCTTLLVIVPVIVFASNETEFSAGLVSMLRHVVLPLCLMVAIGALLLAALPEILYRTLVAILLALLVLVYLQGSFMLWDYGVFDGQRIQWQDFARQGYIDATIWVIVLTSAVIFQRRLLRWHKPILIFLGLVFGLNLITAIAGKDLKYLSVPRPRGTDTLYSFSAEHNFIVIILDAFSSPGFEAVLKNSPELRQTFSGFTFYPNTLAAFSTTAPSIPGLLSGMEYDNTETMRSFLKRALGERSLPAVLERNGYQVNVMSLPQLCPHLGQPCISLGRVVAKDAQQEERSELLELLDVTLFRSLPQVLKKPLYRNQRWFLQRLLSDGGSPRPLFDTVRFVDAFERNANSTASRATFKFLHLMLPHPPYRFDATCTAIENTKGNDKKKYEEQATCALHLTERLLGKLKALGVYDNSTIVISADHGYSIHYLTAQRPKNLPLMEQALPLFLTKLEQANTQDPMAISHVPGRLTDLPRTIADILKINADLPGESILKLQDSSPRMRSYRNYGWNNKLWHRDYMPTMYEFHINGDARDPAAWQPGPVLAAPGK